MMIHREIRERIIGVFCDAYKEMRYGFLETIYQQAMAIALEESGFVVEREVPAEVFFRARDLGGYRLDLGVERKLVLELESCRALEPAHEARLLHSLRASEYEVGQLLLFAPRPEFEPLVFENARKSLIKSAPSAQSAATNKANPGAPAS